MINPIWLNTFITLVETGHFTQTANKLFMTQPGVSQHIKKLEEQTQVQLLYRFGKQFELTIAGEKLYHYGVKLKQEESLLLDSLAEDDAFSGAFHIGCSGSLAMLLYPQLLERQSEHPKLSTHLEAAPNKNIIQDVLSSKLDLGLVTQQDENDLLSYTHLGQSSLCLVLPVSYCQQLSQQQPLQALQQQDGTNGWSEKCDFDLNFQSLNQLGFINHPDGEHYVSQVLQANYQHDYKGFKQLNIRSYINQISQILLPVSQGLGFTVLPQAAVNSFAHAEKLYRYPLPIQVTEQLYLVQKRFRPLPQRYQWFTKLIKKQLPELL
ncbi:hypothetical protein A3K86_20185 [Photobacterium jeanii]|uniref:HTH lysR-type domain-containing protein n=1 Tax=Photobacterium jeanii TaxID=858640 RepID=A0A178K2E2_9GAMM|nr:LysR family transcriptional regulator [Photobacterium jeanii]OAN11277.1 hypothetical protein A3K86_20185 [Photobacterium jeanii]PST90797.1 LysR family transcriptional regulator [Photobacterium jeanii]